MFPEGGQTRKHCFVAMFPEGGQTRKHCFPAMFPESGQTRIQRHKNQDQSLGITTFYYKFYLQRHHVEFYRIFFGGIPQFSTEVAFKLLKDVLSKVYKMIQNI
jgi:hypothetical protein